MSVVVRQAGLLTTVQDKGRYGLQRLGISSSGAIDSWSFMVGNLLVGNRDEAALEVTVQGPVLDIEEECLVAITGAKVSVSVNGQVVPQWQVLLLEPGDTLQVGLIERGMRVYIAFAGGIVGEEFLGSRSVSLPNGIGRRLLRDDRVVIGDWHRMRGLEGRRLKGSIPWEEDTGILRVVKGPQWSWFTYLSIETFLSEVYTVTGNSDRMALRFSGKELLLKEEKNLLSEGNVWGAIQVSSLPMALLADRQTVGGYPKIAIIAGVDLPKAGQLRPGDEVSFLLIDESEARELWQEYLYRLEHLEALWD